ncbi:hypothetical protein C5167_005771 [Papaver somniferum]|uniref:Uncharacterized protein n=1 Tax=Papaver somniferum TaxID=3469 RepID=A0A4Y7JFP1_PAPSO|nr:hypothetical protein C5167_005771 [Papaver somniferum]
MPADDVDRDLDAIAPSERKCRQNHQKTTVRLPLHRALPRSIQGSTVFVSLKSNLQNHFSNLSAEKNQLRKITMFREDNEICFLDSKSTGRIVSRRKEYSLAATKIDPSDADVLS